MCLIVHRPINGKRGSNIPNDVIENNLDANPHGFGIAWREPGAGLMVRKFGPIEHRDFRDLLKDVDRDPSIEYVAHFRLATHGDKCIEMSHPFEYEDPIAGRVLIFHNGVISGVKPEKIADPTGMFEIAESDTSVFVRKILSKLPPLWWRDEGIMAALELAIDGSRLAVMTAEEVVYINAPDWEMHGGLVYSTDPWPWYLQPNNATTDRRYSSKWSDKSDEDDWVASKRASVWDPDAEINLYTSWRHEGHEVYPASKHDVPYEGGGMTEQYGTASCLDCFVDGMWFVYDGELFIDVNHEQVTALLPAGQA